MAKKYTKDEQPHYVLPSDNGELETFTRKFKIDMMEQVVSVIEYALKYHLPFVEVFEFKDSDFVITIPEKDFLTNLDNIYGFYVKNESYEKCPRVVTLQKTLKVKVVSSTPNEKITS
jgi:hypothetical protein